MATPPTQQPITLTQAAITKVEAILADMGDNQTSDYLRVAIKGGGCSGFSYEFDLPPETTEGDTVVTLPASFAVIIDPFSLQYLKGAEVDFQSDTLGEKFIVHNPNAKTTCGCGDSFDAQS